MGQARKRGTYEQRKRGAEARRATLREQMEDALALSQSLTSPEEKKMEEALALSQSLTSPEEKKMEEALALSQSLTSPEEKEKQRKAARTLAALLGFTTGALR